MYWLSGNAMYSRSHASFDVNLFMPHYTWGCMLCYLKLLKYCIQYITNISKKVKTFFSKWQCFESCHLEASRYIGTIYTYMYFISLRPKHGCHQTKVVYWCMLNMYRCPLRVSEHKFIFLLTVLKKRVPISIRDFDLIAPVQLCRSSF